MREETVPTENVTYRELIVFELISQKVPIPIPIGNYSGMHQVQRAPNTPEFAQPCLSRSKLRAVVPSEGVQIWVCLFLYGRSLPQNPHDRPYRNEHTQICTRSLGMTTLRIYSNGAVQIRVCLERAEKLPSPIPIPLPLRCPLFASLSLSAVKLCLSHAPDLRGRQVALRFVGLSVGNWLHMAEGPA